MKLIDADALKKALEPIAKQMNDSLYGDGIYRALKEIDNAPTVPLPNFKEGYKQAIIDGKTNFLKPHGEWIKTGEEHGACNMVYVVRKCSICGFEHSLYIPDNFCPNCGADMRGE